MSSRLVSPCFEEVYWTELTDDLLGQRQLTFSNYFQPEWAHLLLFFLSGSYL